MDTSFVGASRIISRPGTAAVLEPEHATVGAAPMPAAPKKMARYYKLFFT